MLDAAETPHVAVCVATYRRPDGIRRLLASLDQVTFPGRERPPDVTVVVVDNDPAGRVAEVLVDDRGRWPRRVVREGRRGIPFARNAALAVAADERTDFVAFLDDDEEVDPRWLHEALRVAEEHRADVVGGPVVPRYERTPPAWLVRGGFLERPRTQTGRRIDGALTAGAFGPALARRRGHGPLPVVATNNALVRSEVLAEVGGFDERFAFTGGSDRDLFERIARAGHRIVWADEAVVYEDVPATRMRLRWVLQRSFRYGNNVVVRLRANDASWQRYVAEAMFALASFIWGALVAVSGVLRGRHVAVRGLRSIARSLGTGSGMLGHTYEEYRGAAGDAGEGSW